MEMIKMFLVILMPSLCKAVASINGLALSNCRDQCGHVLIPYPFGMGKGCYMTPSFEVTCDQSSNPPKPILTSTGMELLQVSLTGYVQVNNLVIPSDCSLDEYQSTVSLSVNNSTGFKFSGTYNRFTSMACGYYAMLSLKDSNTSTSLLDVVGGCLSVCDNDRVPKKEMKHCNGVNCCQITIPDLDFSFNLDMAKILQDSRCNSSFIVDQLWFTFHSNLDDVGQRDHVPAVLRWGIHQGNCVIGKSLFTNRTFCDDTGVCWEQVSPAQLCICSDQSTKLIPYVRQRCKARECMPGYTYSFRCRLVCVEGKDCPCPDGYTTRSFLRQNISSCISPVDQYSSSRESLITATLIGFAIGFGFLLSCIACWQLYEMLKRRKAIKVRQKCFERNGGLLLQQQLTTRGTNVEQTKLFGSLELEKATDNYNANRILGKGGQGTVYKGMLTDGRIVAIKKSKLVDERIREEFINELVILSQVNNHRNVVKLLGCCLETEVPLLVYEFVPNGTLYQHLHDLNGEFPITWEMRLQIAKEAASAVSFLHSAASVPVYHRDIKSMNILLDDKYRAKLSDFGFARSITVDQSHLTTRVLGTFGYLDPEYFRSSKFTEKSDVYSFGVVLVELLTGQKPLSTTQSTEEVRNLAKYFLDSMKETCFFDILDARVLKEGEKEDIMAVAKLARRCLDSNVKKRPTMKALAMLLEGIRPSNGTSATSHEEYEEDDYDSLDMVDDYYDTSFGGFKMPKKNGCLLVPVAENG